MLCVQVHVHVHAAGAETRRDNIIEIIEIIEIHSYIQGYQTGPSPYNSSRRGMWVGVDVMLCVQVHVHVHAAGADTRRDNIIEIHSCIQE